MVASPDETQDPWRSKAKAPAAPMSTLTAEIFQRHYHLLCRIARSYMRNHRDPFFPVPAGLVHEAYLRLARRRNWRDSNHFLGTAAITLRGLLADHTRKHAAHKRSGGRRRITLKKVDKIRVSVRHSVDALTIRELVEELALSSPRLAKVIELRFFHAQTIYETAASLRLAESTVEADWRAARAWLRAQFIGTDAA